MEMEMWTSLLAGFTAIIWIFNGILAQEAYDCLADRSAAAEARSIADARRAAPVEPVDPHAFDPTRPSVYRYTQNTQIDPDSARKSPRKLAGQIYHESHTTIVANR
jgi:hypothetical protein